MGTLYCLCNFAANLKRIKLKFIEDNSAAYVLVHLYLKVQP